MNFRKGKERDHPEINLIAFIDVLLVILIFLMVTTTYSRITALRITLPTADAPKSQQHPFEVNVAVDPQGRYAINNVRVAARDPAVLADELRSAVTGPGRTDAVVIINADATAAHQSVINILVAARLAGIERVTFAAQAGGKA